MFCIVSLTQDLWAQEYPYIYRSAYYLGRGDTGIAAAENEEAIFYNPAGLAKGKGIYNKTVLASPMIEFSSTTKDVVRKITNEKESPIDTLIEQEGKPQHLGFNTFTGILLRRAALGVFASSSNTAMLFKDPNAGSLEAISFTSVSYVGLTFSIAQGFANEQFLFGVTGKVLTKAQAGFSANASEAETLGDLKAEDLAMQGKGTGADLGFIWNPKLNNGFTMGLTIQDLGNTSFEPASKTDLSASERPLKDNLQTVNLGFSIEPSTKVSKFKILFDYRDILDATKESPFKKFHLGSEISVKDIIGFTAGMNQGYPTFGFYFDIRVFRLDLGYYTEELESHVGRRPDSRFYFKLSSSI